MAAQMLGFGLSPSNHVCTPKSQAKDASHWMSAWVPCINTCNMSHCHPALTKGQTLQFDSFLPLEWPSWTSGKLYLWDFVTDNYSLPAVAEHECPIPLCSDLICSRESICLQDVYTDSGMKRKGHDFPLQEGLRVSQDSRQLWLHQRPFKLKRGQS